MRVIILLKIRFEMLQQCYFFLQFLREIGERVLRHHILLFVSGDCFPLVVEELGATCFSNYFGWVIEKNTSWHIWKQVAKTIFWRVINPFSHPNLSGLVYWRLILSRRLRSLHGSVMADFDWLSPNLLTSWVSLIYETLVLVWRGGSYGDRRNILLDTSLVLYLWHFIGLFSSSHWVNRSIVSSSSSICENSCLPRCARSLTAMHASTSSSQRISWSSISKSSWKSWCRLISNTSTLNSSLWHELSDILPRWWTS